MFINYCLSLILLFMFSCMDKNNTNTNNDDNAAKKLVKVWSKIDTANVLGVSSPDFTLPPKLSKDGSYLYAPTSAHGGNIFVLTTNGDMINHAHDKTKWTKLNFTTISDNGYIYTFNATKSGLALAWKTTPTDEAYALYFEGDKLKHGWKGNDFIALGFRANEIFYNFFLIDNGPTEIPYILGNVSGTSASRLYTGKLGSSLTAALGFNGGNYNLNLAKLAQSADTIFLVSRHGISKLPVKDAGSSTDFSKVDKTTPIWGYDVWNMGDPLTDNINVSDALVYNNKLYVSFNAPHSYQGGVAIYDLSNNSVVPPSKNIWDKIDVRQLAIDAKQNKVWAVTAKELIEVKEDGSMGEKLNAAIMKANQDQSSNQENDKYSGYMPEDDIFGVIFTDNGIMMVTDKEMHVMSLKYIDINNK